MEAGRHTLDGPLPQGISERNSEFGIQKKSERHSESQPSLPPYGEPASRKLLTHLPRHRFPYGSPPVKRDVGLKDQMIRLQTIVAVSFLVATLLLAGCDRSRLRPDEPLSAATITTMFSGEVEKSLPIETAQEILPFLAKADHQYNDGSPHPRIKFRLRLQQRDTIEDFYFLDDFSLISSRLSASEKETVEQWLRRQTEL